jgi:hypothetical protein
MKTRNDLILTDSFYLPQELFLWTTLYEYAVFTSHFKVLITPDEHPLDMGEGLWVALCNTVLVDVNSPLHSHNIFLR